MMNPDSKNSKPALLATAGGAIGLTYAEAMAVKTDPGSLRVDVEQMIVNTSCFNAAADKSAGLTTGDRITRALAFLGEAGALFERYANTTDAKNASPEEATRIGEQLLAELRPIIAARGGGAEAFLDMAALRVFMDRMQVEAAEDFLCAEHMKTIVPLASAILNDREKETNVPVDEPKTSDLEAVLGAMMAGVTRKDRSVS
jgi:hypothetical protein